MFKLKDIHIPKVKKLGLKNKSAPPKIPEKQPFENEIETNHPTITLPQFKNYNFHNIHISTIFVTNEINGFDDLGIILHDDSIRPMSTEILKYSVFRDRISIEKVKNEHSVKNSEGHLLIGINSTMLKYRGIDYANSILRQEIKKWPVINLITLSLDLKPEDLPYWKIPDYANSKNTVNA